MVAALVLVIALAALKGNLGKRAGLTLLAAYPLFLLTLFWRF